jgi:hypothetical protein
VSVLCLCHSGCAHLSAYSRLRGLCATLWSQYVAQERIIVPCMNVDEILLIINKSDEDVCTIVTTLVTRIIGTWSHLWLSVDFVSGQK